MGPKWKVIEGDDGYLETIETVVSMNHLSALSMRMYDLGWLLNSVNGVISKIQISTNVQTNPLVFVDFIHPTSYDIHEEVPEHFPVN